MKSMKRRAIGIRQQAIGDTRVAEMSYGFAYAVFLMPVAYCLMPIN